MKAVLARIFQQNTQPHLGWSCTPLRPVPCEGASVEGRCWFVPYVLDGKFIEYRQVIQDAKPQADAIRCLRVQVEGQTYWISIEDDAALSVFTEACNLCCAEGTPTITAGPLPSPIIEDDGVANEDGDFIYYGSTPSPLTGQKIAFVGSFGGVAVAGDGAGYTTIDLLVTALNTLFGVTYDAVFTKVTNDNGTFTVKMVTGTVTSARLDIALLSQSFCTGTLTLPISFNKITHNEVITTLDETVTATTMAEVIAAVANTMADGNVSNPFTTKLQYSGPGIPATLKLDSTTKATFTAGVCTAPATTTVPATTTAP